MFISSPPPPRRTVVMWGVVVAEVSPKGCSVFWKALSNPSSPTSRGRAVRSPMNRGVVKLRW